MSKRFTFNDDNFIVAYLDAIGDGIGPRDLGRSKASVNNRAKKLKACGAWDAIERITQAQQEYLRCLGHDDMDCQITTIARVL